MESQQMLFFFVIVKCITTWRSSGVVTVHNSVGLEISHVKTNKTLHGGRGCSDSEWFEYSRPGNPWCGMWLCLISPPLQPLSVNLPPIPFNLCSTFPRAYRRWGHLMERRGSDPNVRSFFSRTCIEIFKWNFLKKLWFTKLTCAMSRHWTHVLFHILMMISCHKIAKKCM